MFQLSNFALQGQEKLRKKKLPDTTLVERITNDSSQTREGLSTGDDSSEKGI